MQDHFLEHLGGLYCDGVEEIFVFQDVCVYDLERLCVDFYRFVKDILGLNGLECCLALQKHGEQKHGAVNLNQ